MIKKDIKLPIIKITPRATEPSPHSVYLLRYRNNIVTKLYLSPVSRSVIKETNREQRGYYKFSSQTPHKISKKHLKSQGLTVFKDNKIQQLYENILKQYSNLPDL
jgi:hypothetical protein